MMIYCCEKCRFLFSRSGAVENCPAWRQPRIRFAEEEEAAEFKKRPEQPERIWQSDGGGV